MLEVIKCSNRDQVISSIVERHKPKNATTTCTSLSDFWRAVALKQAEPRRELEKVLAAVQAHEQQNDAFAKALEAKGLSTQGPQCARQH